MLLHKGSRSRRASPRAALIGVALALAGAAGLWVNDALCVRQHGRDQALIGAVMRADTRAAVAALENDASANARPGVVRSLWRDFLYTARGGGTRYYRGRGFVSRSGSRPLADPIILQAVGVGDASLVEVLLERGADVNARSAPGKRPLHVAEARNSPELVALLLRHGAPVDSPDGGGVTPLMHAAALGHRDMVALLLRSGADPNRRDRAGRTVLRWAAMFRPDSQTIHLLRRAGAR